MAHAQRVLRNKWTHNDDHELEKFVDDEEILIDAMDLSDNLSDHEEISSATWDDTSGPTLGTPSVSGGVVEFTHQGVGSSVLKTVTSYATYLASLLIYKLASASITFGRVVAGIVTSGTGVGAAAGSDVAFCIIPTGSTAVDLTGKYIAAKMPSGAVVRAGPLAFLYFSGPYRYYNGPLLDDLEAADDVGTDLAWAMVDEAEMSQAEAQDNSDTYDLYAAKPVQTIRTHLRFTDPTNPDSDGYTP